MTSTRRAPVLVVGGALVYALVTGFLLGTGGAPAALVDAPAALARLQRENAWALPAMGALLLAAGGAAFALASRGRRAAGSATGALGAYVGGFVAFWLANDATGALFVAGLALVWSWMAIVAGALLPLVTRARRA